MLVEREHGATEDVGGETLLSVLVLEGLLPVGGGELEGAAARPARQEAEEVAQVGPGLDSVELAARDERDEGDIDDGAVVAADEEPVFPVMWSFP
jgi:hypothetical protein